MEDKLKILANREINKTLTQELVERSLLNVIKEIANRSKNLIVLETGCGYGFFTQKVSKYCTKLYATDLFDCFPKKLKKNNTINYVSGIDATKLIFDDNFFDVVFNIDVIEHIEDDVSFIKEAFRVLKPNGRLIIGTPNKNRLSRTILKLICRETKYPLILGKDPYYGKIIHYREYTVEDFRSLLEKSDYQYKLLNIDYLSFGILGRLEINCPRFLRKYAHFLNFVVEKKVTK